MSFLLDVNVLVALSWPNHLFHGRARRWFDDHAGRGWMTTPMTESGFVRISCNRAVFPIKLAPDDALRQLERLRARPGHRFLPDDVEMVVGPRERPGARILGHQAVTDAHLLALARHAGAVLATLDGGLTVLAGDRPGDLLVLPPLER